MLDEFRSTLITWDKATSRIYSPVTANESDENGRKLVVQIVNGGQVEDLTGATLHLYWETRDKAHDGLDVFDAVDLKKGEFELSYTTGMLSNKGVLNANLVLIDTVGRVVSERFKITVTEGIDNDAIQSENSFSSLTQALIEVGPRLNDLTAQLQQTSQQVTNLGTTKADQTNVDTQVSGLDQRIDNLVIPISPENANIEVTDSHVSVAKGKTFASLPERLEESDSELISLKGKSEVNVLPNGVRDNFTTDGFKGTLRKRVGNVSITSENLDRTARPNYTRIIFTLPTDTENGNPGVVEGKVLVDGWTEMTFSEIETGNFNNSGYYHSNDGKIYFALPAGYTIAQGREALIGTSVKYQLENEKIEIISDLTAYNKEVVRLSEEVDNVYSIFEEAHKNNMLSLDKNNWVIGNYTSTGIGNPYTIGTAVNRMRYINLVEIKPNTHYSYTNKSSEIFKIALTQIDQNDNLVTFPQMSNDDEIIIQTEPQALKLAITIGKNDDSTMSSEEIDNLRIKLEESKQPTEFSLSISDREKILINTRNENNNINLSDVYKSIMFPTTKTRYVAHRGLSSDAPENTIPAFELAGQGGYYGAESDLRITRDNEFVMMHDATVDRTTNGTGNVSDLTLAEIRALTIVSGTNIENYPNLQVPTFREYLTACRKYGAVPIVHGGAYDFEPFIDKLVDEIIDSGFEATVIIISDKRLFLEAIREKLPKIHLQYMPSSITESTIATAKSLGNATISVGATTSYTKDDFDKAHREGVLVSIWVVNDNLTRDTLVSYGVDFITTDGIDF